jgi:hypothetical protein
MYGFMLRAVPWFVHLSSVHFRLTPYPYVTASPERFQENLSCFRNNLYPVKVQLQSLSFASVSGRGRNPVRKVWMPGHARHDMRANRPGRSTDRRMHANKKGRRDDGPGILSVQQCGDYAVLTRRIQPTRPMPMLPSSNAPGAGTVGGLSVESWEPGLISQDTLPFFVVTLP